MKASENKVKNVIKLFSIIILVFFTVSQANSAETAKLLKTDWSFKGLFGKFDRGALQRGYQVYTEICSSCHSMKYVSYRNLAEKGFRLPQKATFFYPKLLSGLVINKFES